MTAERVYVQDLSSGRVHKRFRESPGGPLAAFEACNADDAGRSREVDDLKGIALALLCERCFPASDAGSVLAASHARLNDEYAAERDPDG